MNKEELREGTRMDESEILDNIQAIASDWCSGRILIDEARENWKLQLEECQKGK